MQAHVSKDRRKDVAVMFEAAEMGGPESERSLSEKRKDQDL